MRQAAALCLVSDRAFGLVHRGTGVRQSLIVPGVLMKDGRVARLPAPPSRGSVLS
jgi:hypothetical protein